MIVRREEEAKDKKMKMKRYSLVLSSKEKKLDTLSIKLACWMTFIMVCLSMVAWCGTCGVVLLR